ncbi:diacylglycerol kinase family protein [Caulobacter segnis]|uniref:diacylglycerol/lipid kinase family protein n=1 Tax=Caulobacter segnis TaxID=88688 RepID=UPI002410441F|nr:diacylglycerol kinase family protein [Caulobacter segnis]MDG2523670.1 diacylglycerol kinase family protein [Caulobacter segnis]
MIPGVIRNPKSHGNRGVGPLGAGDGACLFAEPSTPEDLAETLRRFAKAGVSLLVIDGGDGTVREVLTAMPEAFGKRQPLVAVLPSGKTNMLALDLEAPRDWSLQDALKKAEAKAPVTKQRSPMLITWPEGGHPPLQGFIMGAAAFVRATNMAQTVHAWGAFHNLAVAVTLMGAVFRTLTGDESYAWRGGVPMRVAADGEAGYVRSRFVFLATALKRMPFGLKPFGEPRYGLKYLDVDAPPNRLHKAIPKLLKGTGTEELAAAGYRRGDAEVLNLWIPEPFVVDGEIYPGGAVEIRLAAPVTFLAP